MEAARPLQAMTVMAIGEGTDSETTSFSLLLAAAGWHTRAHLPVASLRIRFLFRDGLRRFPWCPDHGWSDGHGQSRRMGDERG